MYELDDLQHAKKDRHPDELSHPLRERGEDEEQFLFHVKYSKSLEGSGKSPVPELTAEIGKVYKKQLTAPAPQSLVPETCLEF